MANFCTDRLDVSGIRDPKINVNAIDRLVMKSESLKALIKAVCQSYSPVDHQTKAFSADFIEGKGEGHIFLLHGPPGTGKTLTAGE
jgi:SpoVK/Ycf46/Vps4 family AAA+-type ATPase